MLMGKMTIKSLSTQIQQLEKLQANVPDILQNVLYEGAGVVADAMREAMDAIPVDEDTQMGFSGKPVNGLQPLQKQGLIDSFGISPMRQEKDGHNVLIGFDGYNEVRTRKYPNGQPNQLIARSLEVGTSFRRAYPFVRKTVRKARKPAEERMKEVLQQEIDKIMK